MKYKMKISKDEINELPTMTFPGKIHLITTKQDALEAAKALAKHKVLGFDTETRPSFKKGEYYDISLLQLATQSDAYLFRMNLHTLPQEIIDLLADPTVIKAGVAVRDDIKGIQKLYPFDDNSFIDLATIAKEKQFKNFGLRALCAIFLEQRLSKRAKITNWEQEKLTKAQIHYAACDAWAGYRLYNIMSEL
ncbi:3'-5' exonuclease [Halobacteriovorax sp. HLS]|uniref:3'-5' exonuclease n=1 Tax=Halobacteriovorax sp. HLS TaxID=2234000 RepID=UPI000FD83617|nr:3'-5' exonuclease [Halobacteriovorax sp. HLS]